MQISSATIDCYLSITAANYTDFQHHHWEIGPSDTIDTAGNNIPTYTWTVNCIGSDSNGSWSTPMGASVTVQRGVKPLSAGNCGAEARITSTNTVSLKQLTNFGTYNIQANGNKNATTHDVSEMAWQIPQQPGQVGGDLITWSASAGTSSMITYQDMGGPVYQLQYGPSTVVPGPPIHFPSGQQIQTGLLVPNIILSSPSVIGGRDWKNGFATFFQTPSGFSARAWWKWTINLA